MNAKIVAAGLWAIAGAVLVHAGHDWKGFLLIVLAFFVTEGADK